MGKPIRKFVLVLEKKYENCQNIILFNSNEISNQQFEMVKVEKYKGITESKKGKYLMCEIDSITNKFSSELEFVKALKCYLPIHKLFIGVSSKGYIKNIKPSFGNFELLEELKLVKDDKLCGDMILTKKEKLVKMLAGKDARFANIYLKDEFYKTTVIKAAVMEIRTVRKHYEHLPLDSDANFVISTRIEQLLEEFDKYHLYRGLFLAHQEYYEKCIKPTNNTEQVKKVVDSKDTECQKTKKLEFKPYEGEQIKF